MVQVIWNSPAGVPEFTQKIASYDLGQSVFSSGTVLRQFRHRIGICCLIAEVAQVERRLNNMATSSDSNATPMRFQSVLQVDVPKGRDGKHKHIVTQLLSDIDQLASGSALKIPLSALPDTKIGRASCRERV